MKTYAIMNGGEPAVTQPNVNGWQVSWNPDDGRWYVTKDEVTRTFAERRNAIKFAKTH